MEPVTNWAALAAIAGVSLVMIVLMIVSKRQDDTNKKNH